MKLKLKIIILSALISILIFLRFYQLGKIPLALYWDELAIGIDAYSISQTGKDINGNHWFQSIIPSYGDYKAPISILLTSLSVSVFNLNEFAVRFPHALISFIGFLALILIIRIIIKNNYPSSNKLETYLLLSLIILTMPWLFQFFRISFESNLSLQFIILSLLFAFLSIEKNRFFIIFSLIFSVLSIYSYFSARYISILFFFSFIIIYFKKIKKNIALYSFIFVILLLSQIPIYKSPFYQISQQYRLSASNVFTNSKLIDTSAQLISQNGISIIKKLIYHRYTFLARDFINNYLQHFSPDFLFFSGDPNPRHHSNFGGQLLFMTFPIFFSGLFFMANNFKNKECQFTLILFLVSPITASVPYEVPHASRSIYLTIPISIIYAFGLIYLSKIIQKSIIFYLLIFLIFINSALYFENYFFHYPQESAYYWQTPNTFMAKYLKNIKNDYKKIHITNKYNKPVLAFLFYNPKYIKKIQTQKIENKIEKYTWTISFDKFNFENFDPNNPTKNSLYFLNTTLWENNQLKQVYLLPNSQESIYIYETK